jgi:uncharacterized protein YndB with AHSA1/START domain
MRAGAVFDEALPAPQAEEERPMSEFGTLRIEADGDRRITVTREFDFPREEVFDAYTEPEHVQHWLGVFGGWSMTTCEIARRVGAATRFVWTGPNGERMGYRAICTEFAPPERLATTATFDEPWFEGKEVGTVIFEERGLRTIVTVRLRYESTRVRDEVLASPMAQGMALSFDKLEEYLAEPAERWMDFEAGGMELGTDVHPAW